MWRYGGIEVWRHTAASSIEAMEVWSAGDALQVCRRADVEAWRYGALEARCRCSDGEVSRYGGLEARCKYVDVETWRSGALEARCYRADRKNGGVEVWRQLQA